MAHLDLTESSAFSLFAQDLTFLAPDGSEIVANMREIDIQTLFMTINALQYGAQMGSCIIMAAVLAVFTARTSMLKPLFLLNVASLILAFLRSLFQALYLVSPWTFFYTRFAGDFSQVSAIDYSNSVAGTVFPLLLTITINASLVLQAHAVCRQIHTSYIKYVLLGISTIILIVVVGLRMTQCITNAQAILQLRGYYDQWLRSATLISSTIAIWWFMSIFMVKLGYTLWMRKKMGWARMTVFQTLALAGGCTMVIPSIFAIFQYTIADHFPEAGSWTMTTAALLLPLSTIWAKMAMEEEVSSLRLSRDSQRSALSNSNISNNRFNSQSSTVACCEERKASVSPSHYPPHKSTIDTIIEHAPTSSSCRDSTEVDLERMGVRVNHSYGVDGEMR